MEDKPLVTVIIPTYKRASLVLRAIRSVQNQTYKNLEIIVVDDASPDDTEEVVKSFADTRVRYIRHERNRGLAAAGRNTGIRAAHGKYIAFLDDDDQWRDTMVEKQLESIKTNDAVLCAARMDSGGIKRHTGTVVTLTDLRKGSDFDPSSLMAKTTVLRECTFDEQLRHGEDWDLFIRIAEKYAIGYVEEPLLFYNDGGHDRITNEAVNLQAAGLEQRTHVLLKHRKFFGPFWFDYHMANVLLIYVGSRRGMFRQFAYAIRRCGIVPVGMVLFGKIKRRWMCKWEKAVRTLFIM